MSWSAPSGHVFATGEVVTAATLNTYVKDNLIDLDRRATLNFAEVTTSQTTTSTTAADLTTAGPSVTVTTGTQVLVLVQASVSIAAATQAIQLYVVVSGATTIAATLIQTTAHTQVTYGQNLAGLWVPTLTAGSNTFKVQYSVTGSTGTFSNRRICVLPLLSA